MKNSIFVLCVLSMLCCMGFCGCGRNGSAETEGIQIMELDDRLGEDAWEGLDEAEEDEAKKPAVQNEAENPKNRHKDNQTGDADSLDGLDEAQKDEQKKPWAEKEAEHAGMDGQEEEEAAGESEKGTKDAVTDRAAVKAAWVKEKLAEMSLEEKVAQLFVITPESLTGYETVVQAGEATKKALDRYPVGGLIFLRNNLKSPQQVTQMLQTQQEYSYGRIGLPLFLSLDEEGGTVARVASSDGFSVPKFESMAKIGQSGNVDRAYEVGDTIGSYLHDLGFNLDYAPVADVLSNPENTVVADRSFGSDAKLVSEMAGAQLAGLQSHHVFGCAKHYPGHGATAGDTHQGYAYTNKTWKELLACEMVPFLDMIDQGTVQFIMVGHISLPNVTGDQMPASCSKAMITDHLRDELGYDGIVITDALQMKAVADQYTSAQIAVKVLQAGADMLLEPESFQNAYQGILDAVAAGTLTKERIDESVRRILSAKYELDIANE